MAPQRSTNGASSNATSRPSLAAQAKSKRSRRILENREPKVVENPKQLLAMRGNNTSEIIVEVLKDLCTLKKPYSKLLSKNNPINAFEDSHSIEFLGKVNDSSLVVVGTHSKKRAHNLVISRLFDNQLYDLYEFMVDPTTFISMADYSVLHPRKATVRIGSRPLLLFQGDGWESQNIQDNSTNAADDQPSLDESQQQHRPLSDMQAIRHLLLDMFHNEHEQQMNLASVDHVIICTASLHNGKPVVALRHYGILLKKSGSRYPRVELDEVGPRMDLHFRRRLQPSTELLKQAILRPTVLNTNLPKNIEAGQMGDRMGRIHVDKQAIESMAIRKPKGTGKRSRIENEMPDMDNDEYDQQMRGAERGNWRRKQNAEVDPQQ